MPFLPVSRQDMEERGIEQLDFICFTGDAYIDHPTFGIAIISRMKRLGSRSELSRSRCATPIT